MDNPLFLLCAVVSASQSDSIRSQRVRRQACRVMVNILPLNNSLEVFTIISSFVDAYVAELVLVCTVAKVVHMNFKLIFLRYIDK